MTGEQLEQFLTTAGWRFERVDERTLASGFQGEMAMFPFFIRLTADWIFFTIVPFVKAQTEEALLFPVYQRLLQLNRVMNLAKFAIDEDADILLTVELPTETVTGSELGDALTALCFYADAHHAELRALTEPAGPDDSPSRTS